MSSLDICVGFREVQWDASYFRASTLKKGAKLCDSHHILQAREALGEITCLCVRETNIHQPSYSVKIKIDCGRKVKSAECDCKAGLSQCCKHIAALCIYINTERDSSQTSSLQQWEKPKNIIAEYCKGGNVEEILNGPSNKRPIYYASESENIESLSKKQLYEQIKVIDCAFSKILKAECEGESFFISSSIVQNIVESAVELSERDLLFQCLKQLDKQTVNKLFRCYVVNNLPGDNISLASINYECMLPNDILKFYCENVKVTNSQKHAIAVETREQSLCPSWFQQRKLRISASQNVHQIKTLQSGDYERLASAFLSSKNLNTPAVRYGRANERKALEEYCLLNECRVVQLGLFIKEQQPWLCCSPDGIVVGQDFVNLLEIKCPYSCREKPIVEDKKCNVPYLNITTDGNVKLKEAHVYYTQIQVSMYILNLHNCDLFIYSPKGSVKVNISRNDDFLSSTIPSVEKFYFEHYLPVIFKGTAVNAL